MFTIMSEWRCFHCDEVFIDQTSAADHFGQWQDSAPACKIDAAEYRRMEENHRLHFEEDSELHRELLRKDSEHATALLRAEELGYSRGLADAKKYPEELGLMKAEVSVVAT